MVYNKNAKRRTCVWRDRYELDRPAPVCCPTRDDQHTNLSLVKGLEGCLFLHCGVGFTFLGMTSILKAIGVIESRMCPAKNMPVVEIKLTINITFFQRKILSILSRSRNMLSKKRHPRRKKFASKSNHSKNTLA
ncbi:hypothetical protein MCO_00612 [Bartonella sp. DB5-6]|uniref:hypothetical protein n=1 Tax=Bartonella sp. DB5-6 TaxID=1094755 RepID=UPI00026E9160|nr:hypothetical protein [Bartonella sp. DB5-6]EJF78585.1 hypothetical protein MCO_00612 [Bartonella sp. DB5-6]